MKRLTREKRKRRSDRRRMYITYLLFLILLLCWLVEYMKTTAQAEPTVQYKAELVRDDGSLPGDDTPAMERCYMTEEEIEANENELIEAALLAHAARLDKVTVTHYCTCSRCCGKSDGITATGVRATPGVTVAVDPDVIPLGADVLADYGDGELHYYRADDTGSAVKGARIDLCMESHEAAIQAGVRTATVYFIEEGAI